MKQKILLLCIAILELFPNGIFQNSSAQAQDLMVVLRYTDPKTENAQHRVPPAPISVTQSDHVFTFAEYLAGETIEVVSDGTIVYTSVIGQDGTVVVPDDLTGDFTLVLYVGDKMYSAEVEL